MKKTSSFLKKKGMMYTFAFIAIVIIGMYFYFSHSVKESFTDNNNDCIVRMFYVNWCGHCKKTKPDFQTFMDQNNNTTVNGKKVKVEMIDCEENKQNADLASKFNVKGYPTIVAVVNGQPQQFNGSDRSVQGLNDWLKSII
jgi:thiol-disulfide isomerase/thioredoxin